MDKNVKHTPGPWKWGADVRLTYEDLYEHSVQLGSDSETVVLHQANWPVSKANAHLLAASPDLLAACQNILKCDNTACRPRIHDYEMIRAAVAKATGQDDASSLES